MLGKILDFEDNVERERIKLAKIFADELGQDVSEWEREDYLGYYALLLLKAKKFNKGVDKQSALCYNKYIKEKERGK